MTLKKLLLLFGCFDLFVFSVSKEQERERETDWKEAETGGALSFLLFLDEERKKDSRKRGKEERKKERETKKRRFF